MVIKLCTQNTLQFIVTKIFHTDRRRGKNDRIVGTKVDWGLNNVTFESRHEVKENRAIDIHGGCFVLFSSSSFFFLLCYLHFLSFSRYKSVLELKQQGQN